jgi:hypothetical protein
LTDHSKPREQQLPDKLSALLRLAVEHTKRGAKDPEVTLYMWSWLRRDDDSGPCYACMAGCVMRYGLGIEPGSDSEYTPSYFGDDASKLRAIDGMREGRFVRAAIRMGIYTTDWDDIFNKARAVVLQGFNSSRINGAARPRDYLAAARILEEAGL